MAIGGCDGGRAARGTSRRTRRTETSTNDNTAPPPDDERRQRAPARASRTRSSNELRSARTMIVALPRWNASRRPDASPRGTHGHRRASRSSIGTDGHRRTCSVDKDRHPGQPRDRLREEARVGGHRVPTRPQRVQDVVHVRDANAKLSSSDARSSSPSPDASAARAVSKPPPPPPPARRAPAPAQPRGRARQ